MCWNDTNSKYDLLQDKGKYSMFDTSCQKFWIHITKIPVDHIHKNTVMCDEHTVSLQSSMQFVAARQPIIVLRRVEEQFPAYKEMMVSAMCLCADNRIIVSYCEDLYGQKNKMFCTILMLPFVFYGLRF
jgi:hypothetical protein